MSSYACSLQIIALNMFSAMHIYLKNILTFTGVRAAENVRILT
jgi:hypothetical protein